MPSWINIAEKVSPNQIKIQIPMLRLFGSLLLTFIPYLVGVFIGLKYAKIQEILRSFTKPFIYFVLISIYFSLFNTKFYIFDFNSYEIIYVSLIPWILFFLSGIIAFMFKLKNKQILTIWLGTGLQNTNIAILIINSNFSAPDSDYALILQFNLIFIGPFPVYFWPLIDSLFIKIMKFYDVYDDSEEKEDDNDYITHKVKDLSNNSDKKRLKFIN